MTILKANLKHLYQRWTSVLLFLAAGGTGYFALWLFTLKKGTQGTLPLVCLALYYLGLLLATIPIEVLSKPFSYCLPGHRTVPARFLFVVGWVLCLAWAVPLLFDFELTGEQAMRQLLPRLCTYTVFYWLGVGTVFQFRSWGLSFCFLFLFPLVLLVQQNSNLPVLLEQFVFTHAWSVVVLAILIQYIAYRFLWNDRLARRYCGQFQFGLFDHWNREKIARFQLLRWAERSEEGATESLDSSPRLETVCLARINATENNLRRHIVSGFYRSFGSSFERQRQWLYSVAVSLSLLCFLGYLGWGANIFFVMPIIMVTYLSLHTHSTLLMVGGRRERFYAALALSIASTLIFAVGLVLLTTASQLLVFVMPNLTLRGQSVSFHPLNITMLGVPLFLIPLVWTCTVILPKQTLLSRTLPMVLFMLAFQFTLAFQLTISARHIQSPLSMPLVVVPAILGAWIVFIAVLRYTCMHRCLGIP